MSVEVFHCKLLCEKPQRLQKTTCDFCVIPCVLLLRVTPSQPNDRISLCGPLSVVNTCKHIYIWLIYQYLNCNVIKFGIVPQQASCSDPSSTALWIWLQTDLAGLIELIWRWRCIYTYKISNFFPSLVAIDHSHSSIRAESSKLLLYLISRRILIMERNTCRSES